MMEEIWGPLGEPGWIKALLVVSIIVLAWGVYGMGYAAGQRAIADPDRPTDGRPEDTP